MNDDKGYIADAAQDHAEWSGRDAGENVTKAIALLKASQDLLEQAKCALGRPSERGERCSTCGSRHLDETERKLHQTQSSISSQIDRLENSIRWLAEVIIERNIEGDTRFIGKEI